MKTIQRITAKTIAEHLGVSVATVDRVLNNRGNVKKETYEKVLAAADELGYRPNRLARFLSKKTEYRVAVIYPLYVEFFWEQVEVGFKIALDEFEDYGLQIDTYRPSAPERTAEDILAEVVHSNQYQGIAISPGDEDLTDSIKEAVAKGIKVCTFNQDIPNSNRMFYVGADYRKSGRLAGELIRKFVRSQEKVAILGANDDFQTKEKNKGFIEVVKEHLDVCGPYALVGSEYSKKQLKDVFQNVTGVYVSTAELIKVAEYISELSLENLVVVGHDFNEQLLKYLEADVITATINQDPIGQGYDALSMLFEKMAFEDRIIDTIDKESKLEVIVKENAKFYI